MQLRTTLVGSYPSPSWLLQNPSRTALRDAALVVLKTQELAGIDVLSDGELNRFDPNHPETNGMIDYFVRKMEGVRTSFSVADYDSFRADEGLGYRTTPAGIVQDRIGEGTLNLTEDFRFFRQLTDRPLKFTCTGPHMLTKVLVDRFYRDRAALCSDVAEILRRQLERVEADVIQIDEANISGHPEDTDWALPALNHVLSGIKATKGVHICFGNYAGQTVQKGFWRNLLPFLNGLETDHLVLEFARRGYGELEVFRDLNPGTGLGLGVIDIKDNVIEAPDLIAQRIENAARVLGLERLHFVNPDCGLWMLHRTVADGKIGNLVKGRDLFLARSC